MDGGVKKKQGSVVVEGEYDSFTIYESSVGEKGGRYISKTPYSAANKAASRLFKSTSSNSISFIIQKTTNGSNKKFYSYSATRTKLLNSQYVFKKDENGNKIVSTPMGQILKLNSKNQIINTKGKKQVYDSKDKTKEYSNIQTFDFAPYVIKEISMVVDIKSEEVPAELKEQQKNAKKSKIDVEKKKEQALKKKEKEAEMKAKVQAKKEAKRAKEQAKKEAKRAKEQAKKEAKRAKEQAKKEKKAKKAKKTTKSRKMNGGACGSSCASSY